MTPTILLPQFPELEGLLRLAIAGAIGVLVGIDRELKDKPAGARTYSLVAMGACLFTVAGVVGFGAGDPASRIAAQIVTGIGFLGAGTIIHLRSGVVGLTTAAGLWAMAAIGMAVGAGLYVLGTGGGILMFVVLRFLRTEWIEGQEREPGTPEEATAAKGDADQD